VFFYQPIEVDEVEGIDDALDDWMEGLWDALREEKRREEKRQVTRNKTSILSSYFKLFQMISIYSHLESQSVL